MQGSWAGVVCYLTFHSGCDFCLTRNLVGEEFMKLAVVKLFGLRTLLLFVVLEITCFLKIIIIKKSLV